MADSSAEVGVLAGGCILLFAIVCSIPLGCMSRVEQFFRGTGTTDTRPQGGPTPVNLSPRTQTAGKMREVNTTNLNMRSGPGNGYSVVATFPKKTRIVSFGETKTVNGELWTQASTPDGQTNGWVNLKYLSR